MKKEFIILVLFLISGQAFSQQTPKFQQITSRPKGLTNLAEPIESVDSFLGQDKSGPYILSWRNILFTPSNPVWITIDGNLLKTSEYVLNIDKGEITFNYPIKRTQIVNVKYGYFPEVASKNPNPSLTAPLTIKLASNSFSGLTFTALNSQNLSSAPSMVLGHSFKSKGFTSNYYANPNGKGLDVNDALRLGYSVGSNNSLVANYEKSDKGFSSFSKNFGIVESAEKSNLAGKYNLSKNSNLSFVDSSFKSLNSAAENNNRSAQFNLIGGKNQPSFSYAINESDSTDVKNLKTSNLTENTNFTANLFNGDFLYKNTKNDALLNNVRAVNNQESLLFKTAQLNLGMTNDYKIDAKAGTIESTTNYVNYNTKILGGNVNFSSNQNNSVINNKEVKNDVVAFGFNLKNNNKGFSGLNLNMTENTVISSNNVTNVVNNKASVGYKTFNFNTNTVVSQGNNNATRKDFIEETLSISLPAAKNAPILSYTSTDAIKRNDKGILVGSSNDLTVFKHNYSGLNFGYKLGQTTSFLADGNVISTDSSVGNLTSKIGRGVFSTEKTNNKILANDSNQINQEINIFNYSLAPSKNMPGLELERIDSDSLQSQNLSNTISDKVKITSKIGSTSLNAITSVSSTENNNNKLGETLNNSVSLNTPIWGIASNVNVNYNSILNSSQIGDEAKTGIGISFSPMKSLLFSTEQSDSKLVNNGQTLNYLNNNKFSLNYNLQGTMIQTAINTLETNLNKTEIYDYRAILGNGKTLFQIDSLVRMRESTDKNLNLNKDTTQTSVNLNTSKNLTISGTYVLNPDDPTKPGLTVPIEKRTLGLNAKLGNIDLNGSFSATEHLLGTTADVIAKAGGFNYYGESGFRIGYKKGQTNFYSEVKDQFFTNQNFKNINTYSLGFTQTRGDRLNFSLSGTVVQNKMNGTLAQDYKAEAKLGLKF